jgi:hypothetical protein
MNFWSAPNSSWEPMLKGNPLRSWYFWIAVTFFIYALLGAATMAIRNDGNSQHFLLEMPLLVCFLLVITLTGVDAIRAIRAARSESTAGEVSEAVRKLAFRKFRTFIFYSGGLGILMLLNAEFLR